MSQAHLGSFNGTVTPGVNMLDIFRKKEIEDNPNSILNFGKLVLKKFGISAPVGMNQIDISSLVFPEAVNVNIYYMF